MWTLSNQKLHISLDKSSEVWWKQLFLDEPPLDLTRIDCSRPSNELPDDQQSAISKLQWDEHQKRLGKWLQRNFGNVYTATLWDCFQVIRHRMKFNSTKCCAKRGMWKGHRSRIPPFRQTPLNLDKFLCMYCVDFWINFCVCFVLIYYFIFINYTTFYLQLKFVSISP